MTQFFLDRILSVDYGWVGWDRSALSMEWMKDGDVHDPSGQKLLLLLLLLLYQSVCLEGAMMRG
jgi:hypothetical protein